MIQFDRKPWCLWLLNFMTTVVACYLSKVPYVLYLNLLDIFKGNVYMLDIHNRL